MSKHTFAGREAGGYRLSRRQFLITTGAAIAAAACSTQVGQQSPSGAAVPAGTVNLSAWTIGPDAPSYYRRDNLVSAADLLNKKLGGQTQVHVDATFESGGQWGDYLQKFTLAAEAKTSPDIILAGHENLAPWVGPSYVIPLDDLIKKFQSEGGLKDVIPTLWDAMKLKGKTYGVPQDTEARPMYYRKDLLAKMGWSKDKIDGLPDAVKKGDFAWPDLVATAKEAISKGIVGPGMGWYSRTSKGADIYMFYYQNGGVMQDDATGKLVVVKDALQKHYQVHADAVRNDKIMTQAIYGMDGKIFDQTVMDGKVLFFNAGTWKWKDWQTTYKIVDQVLWDNVCGHVECEVPRARLPAHRQRDDAGAELEALGHQRAPRDPVDAEGRPNLQAGQVPAGDAVHARLHEVHPEPREVRYLRRRPVPLPRRGRAGTGHAGAGGRQRGQGDPESGGRRDHRQVDRHGAHRGNRAP